MISLAGLKTSISLNDKMSAPIMNITNAMNMMLSAWDSLEDATSSGIPADAMENVRTELDKANQSMEEFNNNLDDSDDKANNLGRTIARIAASVGLAKIASDAVEFASDLVEVQNVVDVSFGQNAAVVDEWAKTTLNAFGLNELSAKQFAGTMGAMLKSSGLTGDSVADMSMRIAELAGDMASFYNLSGEEAFAKIRSGISGETEPLKQLGINMSVANLEAFAMAQGIEESYEQMTQAEQVTLRYNYLLNAASDAQGDFARTSDSFANQQKLLQENWKAFTGELATNALPVLTELFTMLNNIISFVSANADWLVPVAAGLAGIVTTIAIFTHTAQIAATATKIWTAAQSALNAVMNMNPVGIIIILVIALITTIIIVTRKLAEMSDVADSAFGIVGGAIFWVGSLFKNLGLTIANFGIGVWNAIGAVCSNIGTAFHNVIANVQGWWYGMLSTVLTVVEGICAALNKIPFIEFDYSGLTAKADEYAKKSAEAYGSKEEYQSISDAFNEGMDTFETFQSGWGKEAFAKGAAWGDGVVNSVSDAFETSIPILPTLEGVEENTADTAQALTTTTEDLKYLRDIAERDTINRFTTAEVKVDMGGVNNTVNQNTDLDGVISYLASNVAEALEVVREGAAYA